MTSIVAGHRRANFFGVSTPPSNLIDVLQLETRRLASHFGFATFGDEFHGKLHFGVFELSGGFADKTAFDAKR